MKKTVNLYPIYYNMLVQFSLVRGVNEPLSDTLQRVLSDKHASLEAKTIASWIREYCDTIPYEKGIKNEILDKILFVNNIDDIQKIPFKTTKYGHTSTVYQPINTKRLVEQLILRGIYPQTYWQSQTKWRGMNVTLSQEEQDSREIQVVRCSDHFTLRNSDNNNVFLEIFRRTALAPSIEIRNAHTGKNACFMIISLVNAEFRSFGLRSRYAKDSLFGVRLEHRDLGNNYEGLYKAFEVLSTQYAQILDIITRMQGQYLLSEQREMMKEECAKLIFGKSIDKYEYNLHYLFDEKFEDRKNMWDRMMYIQDHLYKKSIPYIYINQDGKRFERKKTLSELKWLSAQKIIGKLFELFEAQLKN